MKRRAVPLIAISIIASRLAAGTTDGQTPIAYWSFDSSSGSTYYDITGHGYDAVATGTGVGLATGVIGHALNLSGSDFEISAANSSNDFYLSKFSIECWFYSKISPSQYSAGGAKIFDYSCIHSGMNNGFSFCLDQQGHISLLMSSSNGSQWAVAYSIDTISGMTWYHLVGTYDGSYLKIYINGVMRGLQAYRAMYIKPPNDARIGCERRQDSSNTVQRVNGMIDELKYYDYALTQDTILAHYYQVVPYVVLIPYSPNPTINRLPQLQWYKNPIISTYLIQIDTTQKFASPLFSTTTGDTFYAPGQNLPCDTIYWRVKDNSDIAGWSNLSSLIIKPLAFTIPQISIFWQGDTSKYVKLSFIDKSNCEIGYRIYREQDFSSSFSQILDTISATPSLTDSTIQYIDNSISNNTWYQYRVVVYKSDSSITSTPCTTFTLHYAPSQPRQAIRFTKQSDFPVTISGGWSVLMNDLIIYKDTSGRYAGINVSNPSNPASAGYLDSISLVSYQQITLIPVFLKYGVTNNYANDRVIRGGIHSDRIIVAKDSIVQMYGISGNTLASIGSPLTIHGVVDQSVQLISLNDTLIGVIYDSLNASSLSYKVFSFSPSTLTQRFSWTRGISYWMEMLGLTELINVRPYFHSSYAKTVYISIDSIYATSSMIPPSSQTYYSSTVYANFIPINVSKSIPVNLPLVNAFNTGFRISSTNSLCTSGFPFYQRNYSFKPGNVPTELFVADINDPHPYTTASALGAIYVDSIHKQNQIQNLILDTLKKRVYLIFTNNLSILSYQNDIVGTVPPVEKPFSSHGLTILPNSFPSGVTIVLPYPSISEAADLSFYDLSGRLIDRMRDVTSSAVLWKPRTASTNCYIVMVKTGGRTSARKFMIR